MKNERIETNNSFMIPNLARQRARRQTRWSAVGGLLLLLWLLGGRATAQTYLIFHEDRTSLIANSGNERRTGATADTVTGIQEWTNSEGVVQYDRVYNELYHGPSTTHYLTLDLTDPSTPKIVDGTTFSPYTVWKYDSEGYLSNSASGTSYYLYIDANVDPVRGVKVTATKAEAQPMQYRDGSIYVEIASGIKFFFNYKQNGGNPYWESKDGVTTNRSSEADVYVETARLTIPTLVGPTSLSSGTASYTTSGTLAYTPEYQRFTYGDIQTFDVLSYNDYYVDANTGELVSYERFYTASGTTIEREYFTNLTDLALTPYTAAPAAESDASAFTTEWSLRRADGTACSSTVSDGTVTYDAADDGYPLLLSCKFRHTSSGVESTATLVINNNATPIIGGCVYGGGRMADVEGNAEVIVYNCGVDESRPDKLAITAVYGGNDIAGEVKGAEGATVTIGVEGKSFAPIRIGSVYGGGNGNYAYSAAGTLSADGKTFTSTAGATLQTIRYVRHEEVGSISSDCGTLSTTTVTHTTEAEDVETFTAAAAYKVPTIKRTHIVVGTDYPYIDSLFGGAQAAFVLADADASTVDVDVDIAGGTIYSLFGGNNLSGTIGSDSPNTAKIDITVTATNVTPSAELASSKTTLNRVGDSKYYAETGLGVDHGIRYLFGGGNRVAAPHVVINYQGGQTDTLFAGGNSASVLSTEVNVNCDGTTIYGTHFASDGSPTVPGYKFNASDSRGYIYNVRTLFGGNNLEPMTILPTLTLTRGGIGTVYGGGNSGEMKNTTEERSVMGTDRVVGTYIHLTSPDIFVDYIYGGGQKAGVDAASYIAMEDGHVGNLYGGCNISGNIGLVHAPDVSGAYTYIHGGHVHANLYGGANGYYHCNDLTTYICGSNLADPEYYVGMRIPTLNRSHVKIDGGTLWGNVYGGGRLANVGFGSVEVGSSTRQYDFSGSSHSGLAALASTGTPDYNSGEVRVRIEGEPTIKGDVYSGGDMASIFGTAITFVSGQPTINGSVYGGNDKRGTISGAGSHPLQEGGADLLASDGTTALTGVNASSYVLIEGKPKYIYAVYGGGNGNYDYSELSLCQEATGNNLPIQSSSFVDIHTDAVSDGSSSIGTVYGGGNGVTVRNGVTVLINSGGYTSSPRGLGHTAQVNRIFGGNNAADMNILPDIILKTGLVNNVFGGSNKGRMTGSASRGASGQYYSELGTYIHLNSPTFYVQERIYAGSDQADITNGTFVLVEDGTVREVFGGNDKSGLIGGTCHVTVLGGIVTQLYGGSNGEYDYTLDSYHSSASSTVYTVKAYGQGANDAAPVEAMRVSGQPTCFNTDVQILGGTVEENIYGGGLAGPSYFTNVNLEGTAKVLKDVYGGGRGIVSEIGKCNDEHRGNVEYVQEGKHVGKAVVTLHSVGDGSGVKRVFGGGHAGDVDNTELTLYPTFLHHIDAIYGGCVAGNVVGTASTVINGRVPDPSEGENATTVDTIYGGNDYAGMVYNTNLVVNSGHFITLFGAGNGEYNYTSELASKGWDRHDTVPYSMHVRVTINDVANEANASDTGTVFLSDVYGGGNMGLVGNKYISGFSRGTGYVFDAACNANEQLAVNPETGEEVYGDIILNVHGGSFRNKVFAGAHGVSSSESDKRFFGRALTAAEATAAEGQEVTHPLVRKNTMQLVYGYKQLNMDGGTIYHTLHGGSEYIDDGYYWECQGVDTTAVASAGSTGFTTLRPSSVTNLVGGTVRKSVYGAGYEGTVYGSVYVNIGLNAVDNSEVWKRPYGVAKDQNTVNRASGNSYAGFKPLLVGDPEHPVELVAHHLLVEASVYNGSDWGSAGANAVFSTPGIYGGESRIYIDGRNYYTEDRDPSITTLPVMQITQSIIGSGTSTEGGDVFRFIHFRNYGAHNCAVARNEVFSVQRADLVILDSVYLSFRGEQDRISASVSPDYSFCRINRLTLRHDNFVSLATPAVLIGELRSEKLVPADYPYALVSTPYANDNRPNIPDVCTDACLLYDGAESKNVVMMGNGAYVMVLPFTADPSNPILNTNTKYGPVTGYAYFDVSDESMGYIFARRRVTATPAPVNASDGGFWTPCATDRVGDTTVEHNYYDGSELIYENFNGANPDGEEDLVDGASFRSWQVGDPANSERSRSVIVIANDHPEDNPTKNFKILDGNYASEDIESDWVSWDDNHRFAYAYNTNPLQLPPSKAGHYFTIESITVDNDQGGQIQLVKAGWNPTADPATAAGTTTAGTGAWVAVPGSPAGTDGHGIADDPTHMFGLLVRPRTNFTTTCPGEMTGCTTPVVLDDNGWFTRNNSYSTPLVEQNTMFPEMDFILTYNADFSTTITRNVRLRLREYDGDGNALAPIWVTLTISTVMRDFKENIDLETWAMYNGGIDNDYERKVILPATFKRRQIFLQKIQWEQSGAGEMVVQVNGSGDTLWMKRDGTYTSDKAAADSTILGEKVPYVAMAAAAGCSDAFYMHGLSGSGVMPTYKDFAFTLTPTTYVTENLGNTLGWYDINRGAARSIDLFTDAGHDESTTETCAAIRKTNGTGDELNSEVARTGTDINELLNYSANGIAIGTLDGRATAGLDIRMRYNGNLEYGDCSSVGKLRLTFHYVGQDGSDGEFHVNINVRTRVGGDTIYIASDTVLQRNGVTIDQYGTPDAHIRQERRNEVLTWTSSQYVVNNTLPSYKYGKTPKKYLGSFEEALSSGMYREGDVIAIVGEVKLSGEENITPHGMDESNLVQVIRYSGSHFAFPGKDCAYRGPMVTLTDNSSLTMYNVWFNGSGLTRVKERFTATQTGKGEQTVATDGYYYENSARLKDTLLAHAPMIWVQDNASLTLSFNSRMTNNFNDASQLVESPVATDDVSQHKYLWGGAIGLRGTPSDNPSLRKVPSVMFGDNTHISDNLVVDHRAAYNTTDASAADYRNPDFFYPLTDPKNHGAGVYVDYGHLQIGSGTNGNLIEISRNYYWNPAYHAETLAGRSTPTAFAAAGTAAADSIPTLFVEHGHVLFPEHTVKTGGKAVTGALLCGSGSEETQNEVSLYKLEVDSAMVDGVKTVGNVSYSNIYLTRTAGTYTPGSSDETQMLNNFDATYADLNQYKDYATRGSATSVFTKDFIERHDAQTDYVTFSSQLHPESAIGISKWFPGGSPSYRRDIRDTIFFAYSDGVMRSTNADFVHRNKIFFADSTIFGVDTFYNSRVSGDHIYLHRCATFRKKADRDSIEYRVYLESQCPDGMDSLFFKVQGGIPGYTFAWYLCTYDEADAATPGALELVTGDPDGVHTTAYYTENTERRRFNYKLQGFAEDATYRDPTTGMLGPLVAKDTARLTSFLELRAHENNRIYHYRAVANDLTGKCPIQQDVEIMVKKLESEVSNYHVKTSYDDYPHNERDVLGRSIWDKVPYEGYYTSVPDSDWNYLNSTVGLSTTSYREVADDGNGHTAHTAGHHLVYNDPSSANHSLKLHHYPRITIDGNAIEDEREWLYYFGYLPDGDKMHVPEYILWRDYSGDVENMYWPAMHANGSSVRVPGMTRGHRRVRHTDGPARYIRYYHGYHLYATVQPNPHYGYISRRDYGGEYIDSRDLICPGNIITLNTCTPFEELDFMFWDFDPMAEMETEYVMRASNATVAATYSPETYWYQTVRNENAYDASTNPQGIRTVNTADLEAWDGTAWVDYSVVHPEAPAQLPGYEVNYRGTVTIRNADGLAWLISTVNGLNGQQAQTFVFDTVYILVNEYDMGAHKWTPLGNINHSFRGIFKPHPRERVKESVRVSRSSGSYATHLPRVNNIIVDEEELPLVGFFGSLDSAQVEDLVLHREMLIGHNYVGGLAARAVNHTRMNHVGVHNGIFDGANAVGGLVGTADNVTADKCVLGLRAHFDEATDDWVYDSGEEEVELDWGADPEGMARIEGTTCTESFVWGGSGENTRNLIYVGSDNAAQDVMPDEPDCARNSTERECIEAWRKFAEDSMRYEIHRQVYAVFQREYSSLDILGDAVYAGGIFGQQTSSTVTNCNINVAGTNSRALYFGGVQGKGDDPTAQSNRSPFLRRLFRSKASKAGEFNSRVSNSIVHVITSDDGNLRVGGLVGTASNTQLSNNYVYGEVKAANVGASLVAVAGNNVQMDHCYYNNGVANNTRIGYYEGSGNALNLSPDFSGRGRNVTMSRPIYGVTNLTRALNLWVSEQAAHGDSNYYTWRSSEPDALNPYPVFGPAEMTPVRDSVVVSSCESYEWNGQQYALSGVYTFHTVDSALFADSTAVLVLTLGHASQTSVSDSVEWGSSYSGNGFFLTSEQIASLVGDDDRAEVRVLQLTDSLLSALGCDSVVVLNLTVYRGATGIGDEVVGGFQLQVYPNPTLGQVTVEADGLADIEVYDNVSRRILQRTCTSDREQIDLSHLPSGAYYFRITSAGGVAVKKVVKK